ncbi:LD-carboxypeptidase LdcB/DacB [Streptococcus salivarius]|uniref:LD-carboxypeptidase LdcB/DacB n=5 Tax=Streptococcus salivarius TaxID=1304 RepID=UPI0012BCC129|nr:LD-carboxypeptidase LdcB/DacB [Streptococcus salivarius]MTQ57596.1 YSIRK-type signal peptide-containing protein [Streptococcus salivarius]MTQ59397.1 YSIRK-type signal peptide-containing protein [Streptococcus salivarius]MTQ65720.1 YSIRK-type signal peptide-containing protein [Streptococcus salivarius]MTQ70606.1 YSIRK-type signal peptide-containing protein [Streptococcus salivarius]MTR08206.1 YSIRK-type signal peptide-containing protein [Streptococcus salivarius]
MKREKFLHEQQRFSIRKYSFGAASVLLGASLVFAGQALADEHHEVSTFSDASLFATSDSDAVTAADIFSGVATDGAASSEKASQVSTTSQTASETATSEATSEVSTSTSQATDKTSESTAASSEATSGTNDSSEKATNLAASALTRAAVNTSLVSQPATTTDSDLPSQGTYVYKERTEVKNQPKVSAKAEFYVNPGDSVLYDQVVTADGYQWISYKSYSGVRRYAPVKPVAAGSGNGNSGNGDGKPSSGAQATTGALDIPATGTYYFTRDTDIKKEPKADLKPTFVFSKGDHVIYDKVLTADNHQWISYLGYDYVRYYADIATLTPAKAETPTVKPTESNQTKPEATGAENLPASGTYNVTRSLNVKNEPKASAETLYTLEKGYKVNYDKVLTADNHQWISYISYSGTRRYVDIAALKTTESKPQENRVSGNLTINNQTSNGFDVVVTNVSGGGKEVKEVRVPIWSDKNGQDDLTWYHADKQSDGSYKVHVDTASHKGDAGTYSVHLYYMLDGKRTYITETKATVPQSTESQVTGKLTINNQTSNGFDVVVTNVSGGGKEVKEVRVPIWSDKNGQDDLTWYHADKQSDGSYKVHIDTASHKGDAGTYSVHLYYMLDGKRTYITETKATVPQSVESQVTGKLTISNQTSNGFDVVVTNVSGGDKEVKEVRVPIWSDKNGQDDLTWYHADKQSDGSYKVHVDTASHKGDAGTYSVHLYYMLNGKRTYITETKATVPQSTETQVTGKLTNNGSYYSVRGKYDDIIIVNKKHGLSKDYNPGENPTAKAAFVRLRDDMINQGLNVGRSYSGFRSYDYQKTLYDNYVSRDGQATADRYSARPGYSEHQTGLVFDLTDKSGNLLEDSRASQWLKDNAHNYGFIVRFQAGKEASTGYMPEAWHIRYVGKEAKDIHDSGLSLEEYFGIEGGDYSASSKPAESKPATTGAVNLPATGTYTFTGRASIKAEAKVSSPELAYYDKGMSVNYDKVLTADGHQWLSYVTTSGARRYVDIATVKATETKPEVKPVAKPADKPNLPESGTYTFTGRASIKAEAKVSSPELAYYDKGMTVNYDKVLTADGRQWLSYVTASGARRYVDIAAAKSEAKPETKPVAKPADKPSLPESGTYTFTGRASIKAEAKVSSPELAYYDKGMTVNYDKVLTADGRQWLSYVTTSGARRYVDIAAAKPEASQPAAKPSLPESGRYTFTGRASIKAEAKVSSPELAYYDKGMSVNYDKVLTADGRQWLSYVTASGARRYVDIAAAKPEASQPTAKPSLPESGRYTFTGRASIKAEAKVSSPELAYYDKGMSVNYDKVLTADGHTWLSYMTVSGARRYVDIA